MGSQRRVPDVALVPSDVQIKVADGVGLHVRRHAPPAGTPPGADFLLVHGLSSNALLWDRVAGVLAAAGHTVTAIDLRSHGTSDAPDDGYDTATACADIATVAGALGITGALVAGQSWGGNVVVELAVRHPDVVAGLALVDGGWIDLPAEFRAWEACETALRPPDIDGLPGENMRRYMRDAHPDWSDHAIDATMANLSIQPDGTVRRRLSIPRHMSIVRAMWDNPPQPWFAAVRVPVMLIPAYSADPERAAGRRARVAAAAAALPDATIREYAGADHDLHAQHPRELAADLLDLAARVRPVAG